MERNLSDLDFRPGRSATYRSRLERISIFLLDNRDSSFLCVTEGFASKLGENAERSWTDSSFVSYMLTI